VGAEAATTQQKQFGKSLSEYDLRKAESRRYSVPEVCQSAFMTTVSDNVLIRRNVPH